MSNQGVNHDLRADDPNSQSFVFRLTSSLKNITSTALAGVSKAAFEFYGTYADAYGPVVDELFSETYFLEQWMIELLTL
jgi:hypothetical protein